MQQSRIRALDGVRGLAILFVFAFHLTSQFPDSSIARAVTSWGWMGVDLFFALSGFLITGILLDTVGRSGYFTTFYLRRVLRIWPAYLTCLTVITAVAIYLVWSRNDPAATLFLAEKPWYWLHATNLLTAKVHQFWATPLGTGHLWSLAVEEQFYLIWPFVILFVGRTPNRAARVAATLIVGAFVLRVALYRLGVDSLAIYQLMPTRVDSLAWGALVAAMWRRDRGLVWSIAPILVGAGVIGLAVLTLRLGAPLPFSPSFFELGYSLAGMASAGVVAYAITLQRHTWLSHTLLRRLGKYSYALYLWHVPILSVLRQLDISDVEFALLAVLLTAVAAGLSWVLIEQPALAVRSYLEARVRSLLEPKLEPQPMGEVAE